VTDDWTNVWLGTIAAATLIMATIQVGVIVGFLLIYRRVNKLSARVEREMQPLIDKVNAIGADAARISALATQQAERADELMANVSRRVETTVAVVQSAIIAPARESLAVVSALKATMGAFRRPRRGRRDEDDPLFIG